MNIFISLFIFLISTHTLTFITFGLIWFMFVMIFGGNIGMHRYFAHKSFNTTRNKRYFLGIMTLFTGLGSPLTFGASHRIHHSYTDTEKDPHSPKYLSFKQIWKNDLVKVKLSKSNFKGLYDDDLTKFLHKNHKENVTFILTLALLISPTFAFYFIVLPTLLGRCIGVALAYMPHHGKGYRNFNTEDESYNNWLLHLITFGEGWHNNHHRYPYKWNTKVKWWEFDPPAFIIKHFFMVKENEVSNKT